MPEISHKKRQFDRLFASTYDFAQANFCARYLLKKGWHSNPWKRRGTIYQQQTAFVTNLIIAYARPFVGSKGWPAFPSKLTRFDTAQQDIHKKLLQMRHEVFAHSDSDHFNFRPVDMGSFRTTIERAPFAVLSSDETERVKVMTGDLIKATRKKLDELHRELVETDRVETVPAQFRRLLDQLDVGDVVTVTSSDDDTAN